MPCRDICALGYSYLRGTRRIGRVCSCLPGLVLRPKNGENLLEVRIRTLSSPLSQQFKLIEFCEFEKPVEQMESLLFVCTRMIDCLVERASSRALSLAALKADMKLEGGKTHRCTIRPALPSIDRKFLLKLLQLEIAAHSPQCGVMTLTLSAEAGQSSKVQLGLFSPQTPEPSRLDVTIARLKAIVGDDRVGSPALEDTHRSNSFHMEDFTITSKSSASANRASTIGATEESGHVCQSVLCSMTCDLLNSKIKMPAI